MTPDSRWSGRLLLLAAAAGLVIRLGFSFGYWNHKPLTHDEREYLSLAASLAAGQGLVHSAAFETGTGQQFGRAPGYPLLLRAIGVDGSAVATPARVKLAQALLGAVIVWLIGVLASRAGGWRSGVVAAWIAACYPPLVTLPAYVLSETLFGVFALGAALALQGAISVVDRRPRLALAAAAGVLSGIAALVRPAMLFFLPLAASWLVLNRRPRAAALLAACAVLVVAPWTMRNLRVYERLVLVASEGGVTFWTGNHPLAIGEGDLAANPALKLADLELRRRYAGLSPEALEPVYYREAFAFIRDHPARWLLLVSRKAFYLAVPVGPSYTLHSTLYYAASAVPYLLLLPLAVAGGRRLWRGPQPPAALCLLAGSAVLVCLVFFPQERFRIPVIDPTLIVCTSGLAGRVRP